MKYFHDLNSFIKEGWKQPSTWLGIIILFGWIYNKEIDKLIIEVLTSSQLITYCVNGVATLAGALLIYFNKQNKK